MKILNEKGEKIMNKEMININANLVAEPIYSNFEREGEEV